MNRYLLDTSVVVWLLTGNRGAVPSSVARVLEDPDHRVLVSAASNWEIAIKRSIAKLRLEDGWAAALRSLDLDHLPITALHAEAVESLPWHHRDPFDRLLVAQASQEQAQLVSPDAQLHAYGPPILWG